MIKAAADAGAKGIVIAGAGAGATSGTQPAGIDYATKKGVFVVTTTRAGSGRIAGRGGRGRGGAAGPPPDEVRRRIANVEARARHTQPERRLVRIRRQGDELSVTTTSQKLAHRVVHELEKAFGGRASYTWSDRDGSLAATWVRD